MEKTILERLIEKSSKEDASKAKRNLSIFLALRDQIRAAIESGWSVKDVWQLLSDEKKLTVSYQVFLRMVKKHTNYKEIKRGARTGKQITGNKTVPLEHKKGSEGNEFQWNNAYNKDDLV